MSYHLKTQLELSKHYKYYCIPDLLRFNLEENGIYLGDILGLYELWYIQEKELLKDISEFMGWVYTPEVEKKIISLWIQVRVRYSELYSLDKLLKIVTPIPLQDIPSNDKFERYNVNQLLSLLNLNILVYDYQIAEDDLDKQLRTISCFNNPKSYENMSIKEIESKVYVLTKNKPYTIIFDDNTFSYDINIDYMIYNNMKRKTNNKYKNIPFYKDKKENTLIAQISMGKNSCYLVSFNYLTKIIFNNEWNKYDQVKLVNEILGRFGIVASTKRDIRVEYIPTNNINVSHFFILLDVITSGKICQYFVTHEQDNTFITHRPDGTLETKKHSFFLDKKKINFVRPALNVFIKTDLIESTIELDYITKMISELIQEYEISKEYIIKDYQNRIFLRRGEIIFQSDTVFDEHKKEKKTKQLVDVLRETEPKIFKNTSYTQKCQKSRQPYIVESQQKFLDILVESLDGPYWNNVFNLQEGEKATLDMIFRKYNITDIKDLLLTFPTQRLIDEEPDIYQDMRQRLYACLPRNKDSNDIFPGLLKNKIKNIDGYDIQVPCCFKRKKDVETQIQASKIATEGYVLGVTRDISNGKYGTIPQYLGSVLSEFKFRRRGAYKPNFINILNEVFRNDLGHINITAEKYWIDNGSLYADEKSYIMINNILSGPDDVILEKINLMSFIFKKNIVIFDTVHIYNSVLITPRLISATLFPHYDKFVGIRINSIGDLESIVTVNSSYIHKNNEFTQYIIFMYNEIKKELVYLE